MIQQSQLTPANVVIAMYEHYSAGHSLQATARKFGMSANGVYKSFRRAGYHVRSRSHALHIVNNTADETRAMYEDYKSGLSHRQIATKYHYSKSAVGQRFKAHGYKSRAPGRASA